MKEPPDILITTPESLFLLLTSQARETLRGIETVIVDEVHAVAGTKRGAHLALSLERLDALLEQPAQRIGLSATQRPLEEIGRFVSGDRPIQLVDAGTRKELDLEVVVPVEDLRELGSSRELAQPVVNDDVEMASGYESTARSIWPSIYPAILELVQQHRSTIVFVNNRRLAERLALRLNELAEEEIARAHHGSLAREQRVLIEEDLKAGRIPCLVATSSLELGIDMGAVDLVIQVESPKSVARGLQRVGRAGHELGSTSKGRIFPKFRADLLESAVVARAMRGGEIEETRIPRNPLDVLAQQIVAIVAEEEIEVDDAARARPRRLPVLRPLAAAARERARHARRPLPVRRVRRAAAADRLGPHRRRHPRPHRRAPARGHERGHDPRPRPLRRPSRRRRRPRRRARRGDGLRGAAGPDVHARRLDLADRGDHARPRDRLAGARRSRRGPVLEGRGRRPAVRARREDRPRLARARRPLRREARSRTSRDEYHLDPRAAQNLLTFLREQAAATGVVPSDRTIVVERFRDEIGDWRVCILTPFGGRVHAPWGMALTARLRDSLGLDAQSIWSDDGIALHLPDADAPPSLADLLIGPDEIEELVVGEVGQTALFGARFRENAARALLIPRRRPGQRTPLWQQRLKAQNLLQVARKYGSFPIILETYRECLQDVFDLPALKNILHGLQTRELDLVEVETASASPFASSLLFDYVATYMYEDDTPPAERRAQALSLDRDLLRELLGQEELRELIDPDALAEVERQLRGDPRDPDELHDVLRRRGDLRAGEYDEAQAAILLAERRALTARIAGEERLIAAEDAGRYRDALGVMPPGGLPEAFLEGGADSLRQLVLRFAKGRGPFTTAEADERFGLELEELLHELERADLLVRGELRPGGTEREWCDPDVLRRLRRASLAALRREVEPAEQAALGRFLPAVARDRPPRDACARRSCRCRGWRCPVSLWESEVLPRRVPGYQPAWLDGLCAAGELVWVGAGLDRVAVYFREDAPVLGRPAGAPPPETRRGGRDPRRARRGARCSGPTCSTRPGSRPRRRCPRSGSSSGPAR